MTLRRTLSALLVLLLALTAGCGYMRVIRNRVPPPKRLDDGKFRWPRIEDGVMRLSPAQLSALLEGIDWARVHSRRVPRPTAVQ